ALGHRARPAEAGEPVSRGVGPPPATARAGGLASGPARRRQIHPGAEAAWRRAVAARPDPRADAARARDRDRACLHRRRAVGLRSGGGTHPRRALQRIFHRQSGRGLASGDDRPFGRRLARTYLGKRAPRAQGALSITAAISPATPVMTPMTKAAITTPIPLRAGAGSSPSR